MTKNCLICENDFHTEYKHHKYCAKCQEIKYELKQYAGLKKEVKQLEALSTEFYDSLGSSPYIDASGIRTNQISDPTAVYADQALKMHRQLLKKKGALVSRLKNIEALVDKLEDSNERQIIREYYINGKTWEEICVIINYAWAHTHRLHKSALKKLSQQI